MQRTGSWASLSGLVGVSGLSPDGNGGPPGHERLSQLRAVQFCERVIAGHFDPLRADTAVGDGGRPDGASPSLEWCQGLQAELRSELWEAYPELGFYVGMTLDEDGMLADGAAALKEQTLVAMELAVMLVHQCHAPHPHSPIRITGMPQRTRT